MRKPIVGGSAVLVSVLVMLLAGCSPTSPSAELEGWWLSTKVPGDVYHIDAETRMFEYGPDWSEPLSYGTAEFYMPIVQTDGSIALRYCGDPGGGAALGSEQLGRYALEPAGRGAFKWTVLEDPIPYRTFFMDGEVFTRAPLLEAAVGVWEATVSGGTRLALRDNMTYALSRGGQAPLDQVSAGAFRWDALASALLLKDESDGACRGKGVGRYAVKSKPGKSLALTALEDGCGERRQSLEAAGAFAPVALPAGLPGNYVDEAEGRYAMHLTAAGLLRVWDGQWPYREPCERAYDVWGDSMRIAESAGAVVCNDAPGDYSVALGDDGVLTLAATSDPCAKRAEFYATHPSWARRP